MMDKVDRENEKNTVPTEDEDVCVRPFDAEHSRLDDMDDPCDDGRAGKI